MKVKVEVEKPVFCAVEQTGRGDIDRYRVVLHKNLQNGKITIDRIEYRLVTVPEEAMKPSINGHFFREFCKTGNEVHKQQYLAHKAIEQEEAARKLQADRALRAEKAKQDRQARWQERRDGAKQAGKILREQAIRRRMMEEVETGQQALPRGLKSVI